MDIKLELLSEWVCEAVRDNFTTLNINPRKIIDTKATKILGEIKEVICNDELDDFMAIDKIVDIFQNTKLTVAIVTIFKIICTL